MPTGIQSGRGGRGRQGEHQRGNDEQLGLSETDDAAGEVAPASAAAATAAGSHHNYTRWQTPKVIIALQALIDAPQRILQTSRFGTSLNHDEQLKTNLSRLECVIFFCNSPRN